MLIASAPTGKVLFRHVIALVIALFGGLILTILSIAVLDFGPIRTIGEWIMPIGAWLWGDLISIALQDGGPAAGVALVILTYWLLWFAVTYALCAWRFRLLPRLLSRNP